MTFLDNVKKRRTIYAIGNEITVSQDRILEIVETALLHCPSAFNSQTSRVVVLFGAYHTKLWSIVMETLRRIVPPEAFAATDEKVNSFVAGYGSILYFEDDATVRGLMETYPTYSDKFPVWSQHASAILQFTIWTALELEGLGASLQHYNPIIDAEVKAEWDVPDDWQLIAQMPFGSVVAQPDAKQFAPIENRMKVFRSIPPCR